MIKENIRHTIINKNLAKKEKGKTFNEAFILAKDACLSGQFLKVCVQKQNKVYTTPKYQLNVRVE